MPRNNPVLQLQLPQLPLLLLRRPPLMLLMLMLLLPLPPDANDDH